MRVDQWVGVIDDRCRNLVEVKDSQKFSPNLLSLAFVTDWVPLVTLQPSGSNQTVGRVYLVLRRKLRPWITLMPID